MSVFVLTSIVLLASVSGAMLLVLALRRARFEKTAFHGTDDVETFTVTVVGGIYGIIMAFMIFAVWTKFDNTNQSVQNESKNLTDLYRLTESLPPALRDELRKDCREYVVVMIHDEWPAMARGDSSPRAWQLVNHMWNVMSTLTPDKLPDEVLHDHVLSTFTRLTDARRYRLFRAGETIPSLLWGLLAFGGVLTVFLSAMFRVEPPLQHLVKTGALAAMISFCLLAVWDLDGAFNGPVRVPPDAFNEAIYVMHGATGHVPNLAE